MLNTRRHSRPLNRDQSRFGSRYFRSRAWAALGVIGLGACSSVVEQRQWEEGVEAALPESYEIADERIEFRNNPDWFTFFDNEELKELVRYAFSSSPSLNGVRAREALAALGNGMMIALLVMYGLLAVIFRSYGQPLLVLIAIPFGFVGALFGHLIMGFDLSLVSMFGLVALAGVVVNDSLVLIATINSRRDDDERIEDLVTEGAMRRFRPVLLTSLTTFFGLAPMIFETSLQARFLIPMALSLGFGVLFVTVIALVIVPSLYCVFEDIKTLFRSR